MLYTDAVASFRDAFKIRIERNNSRFIYFSVFGTPRCLDQPLF